MKSGNRNGNGNGQRNSSRKKKHLKTDNNDNRLNVGGVAERCSGCFVSRRNGVLGTDHHGQYRAAERELKRGGLR